jgi:hypothetical protein
MAANGSYSAETQAHATEWLSRFMEDDASWPVWRQLLSCEVRTQGQTKLCDPNFRSNCASFNVCHLDFHRWVWWHKNMCDIFWIPTFNRQRPLKHKNPSFFVSDPLAPPLFPKYRSYPTSTQHFPFTNVSLTHSFSFIAVLVWNRQHKFDFSLPTL